MAKKDTQKDEETRKVVNIAWMSAIGVLLVWALTFFLLFINGSEERGQFGDMFGAVNALFSGLAFAGLIITLILQRRELELQRDELVQTRNEFAEQNKTMRRQRFENTFFNLMTLHQHITDSLEYECLDGADMFESKGRDVFKKFYFEKDNYDGTHGIKGYLSAKTIDNLSKYSDFDFFNHYFHFFDGIVSYIDGSELLENEERYQYFVMLRNTLSDAERYMMFYYYAASGGWHKQKAEDYALFYDVDPKGLAKEEHYGQFAAEAYNHRIV